MSVDGELGEAVDKEGERIESLRQQKAKDKSAFTRIKNKVLSLLDEEDYPSWREVKAMCQKLCEMQERTMLTMEELSQEYLSSKDKEKRKKLTGEIDKLEAEFSKAHDKAQEEEESVVGKSVGKQALEEQGK